MGRTSRAATKVRSERTFRSGPYLHELFTANGGRVDAYLERAICERIRQARKEAGFTQEEIAGLLNVTLRAYQNYERDRVPFRRLGEIAKLTGVEPEWLLRGDPPASSEAARELLADVADAIATLERSHQSAHEKLDEVLRLLGTLVGGQLPPAETPQR